MRITKRGWRHKTPAKPTDLRPIIKKAKLAATAAIEYRQIMNSKKPWYKSKTLHGLAVVALGIASKKFGWGLGDAETARLIADVLEIIGLSYAAYGRVTAKEGLK